MHHRLHPKPLWKTVSNLVIKLHTDSLAMTSCVSLTVTKLLDSLLDQADITGATKNVPS